jgi:predicted O-methyltransferase YrrM
MRKMGYTHSFVAIDNDPDASSIAQYWINRCELNDYIRLLKKNSVDPELPARVLHEFDEDSIRMVFINSSNGYEQTLQELSLWYPHLAKNGIILMHNANDFASQYDATKKGGVSRALKEWSYKSKANYFVLNNSIEKDKSYESSDLTYKDLGGMSIIQK